MTPSRLTPSRRALVVVSAVIVAQLAVFALVWNDSRDAQIRQVPVTIAAPPIVAEGLVADVGKLEGKPFDARIAASPEEAKDDVTAGVVVAALYVDLVATRDTLYVASAQGRTLTDAVADTVRAVERGLGRDVRVVDLVPAPGADTDLRTTRLLVTAWMVIGFAAAAGATFVTGTRPERRPVFGLPALTGLALAAGVGGAVATSGIHDGSWLALAAVGGLTTFTAGAATTALRCLFGLPGIGVATVVFLMLAGPDAIATHSLLLPQPWPAIDPWVPHGAAASAVISIAYFGAHTALKPVLVLVTWAVLSVAVTILSRREIARAETRG